MTFTTKDSGKRVQFEGGGQRDTAEGKPDFYLIMPKCLPYEEQLLTRWAALMERGARKYSARNWELFQGEEELDRARSSAFRHFMQWVAGETDEDHAAAVLFNIQAAEMIKWKLATLKDCKTCGNVPHTCDSCWEGDDSEYQAGYAVGYSNGLFEGYYECLEELNE